MELKFWQVVGVYLNFYVLFFRENGLSVVLEMSEFVAPAKSEHKIWSTELFFIRSIHVPSYYEFWNMQVKDCSVEFVRSYYSRFIELDYFSLFATHYWCNLVSVSFFEFSLTNIFSIIQFIVWVYCIERCMVFCAYVLGGGISDKFWVFPGIFDFF